MPSHTINSSLTKTQLIATIAALQDQLSAAWVQARKWRDERNVIRTQSNSYNFNSSKVPTSPSCDPALSAAWVQARKWRAERDALRAQVNTLSGVPGDWDGASPPGTPVTPTSSSAAWAQGRTWRAERDAARLEIMQLRAEMTAAATLSAWGGGEPGDTWDGTASSMLHGPCA